MDTVSRNMLLMGNRFSITVIDESKQKAELHIDAAVEEIKRLETLLTTFSDTSVTNQINKYAGIKPILVDHETFGLIERSLKISALTNGTFDISYGSIDKKFWNFDKTMTVLPDKIEAQNTVALIDYKNIEINKTTKTIFLKKKGMRIGFGGIGKGFAADKARELLIKRGVKSGVVNASGDLTTWGTQSDGSPWTVALAHPDHPNRAFSKLNISGLAVATSGNYEKFVLIGGKKYSHTIDPASGFPISGIKSVSVICPIAELADAMATPIAILGIEKGIDLINQMENIACVIIDDNNNLFCSKNINLN